MAPYDYSVTNKPFLSVTQVGAGSVQRTYGAFGGSEGGGLAARMEQFDYNQPSYNNTAINSRYDMYSKQHVQTNFDLNA